MYDALSSCVCLTRSWFDTRTEALLYSHLLSLPYFLFFADDIGARIAQWHAQPALVVSVLGTEVHTTIWVALLVNGFTQYLCISAVFQLLSCVTKWLQRVY